MEPVEHSARPVLLVTRPQPQADAWVQRLVALGQPALALPLLRIEADAAFAPAVHEAWAGLANLPSCELLMFVSPNAVASFFAARPPGLAWPGGTWAAATGPGSVAALREAGVPEQRILAPRADSPSFDAETLWAQSLAHRDWQGRSVIIVRGESGRDWLADHLRQAGAKVNCLAAYRQCPPLWDESAQHVLAQVAAQPPRHVWLFSSSNAIRHLVDHALSQSSGDNKLLPALLQVPVLATHPRIAQTAKSLGFADVRTATPDPTLVAEMAARGVA